MASIRTLKWLAIVAIVATSLLQSAEVQAGPVFDGAADNQTDAFGYYYAITGGKFPTGNIPNGDNASGGTFARVWDDPFWPGTTDVWTKDDWFPQNAGLALTLYNGVTSVYDNNGIDDGSYGDFYNATAQGVNTADAPGLYRGYSMSNNFDHIYATYFKLEEDTTFDTLVGFFDANSGLDPFSDQLGFRMNIWSSVGTSPNLLPTNTGSFVGDIFSSDLFAGTTTISDSGVDRVFGVDFGSATDDIFRFEYKLNAPITLAAGEYFFSHDAIVTPEPSTLALLGMGVAGFFGHGIRRRRKQS